MPINSSIASYYHPDEVQLACDRFKSVTGQRTHEFLVWIGYDSPFAEDMVRIFPIQFVVGVGMVADIKMRSMLSPHWHALLKASLIREGK